MVLESLTDAFATARSMLEEQAGRVEEAIAALADPEAVAQTISTAQAEGAKAVAEANERVAHAKVAQSRAEAQAKAAAAEAGEAESAGAMAWERLEAAEANIQTLRDQLDQASTEMAGRQAEHESALAAQRSACAQDLAELRDAAGLRERELEDARAQAEGVAQALRTEIDQRDTEAAARLAETQARLRAEAQAALGDLGQRHAAQVDAMRARAEGELGGEHARLVAANEMLEALKVASARHATDADAMVAQIRATAEAHAQRATEAVAARTAAERTADELAAALASSDKPPTAGASRPQRPRSTTKTKGEPT